MLHEGPQAPAAPLQEKVFPRHRMWIREVRVAVDSGRSGAAANVGGEQRMKQMSVRKKMPGGPKSKIFFLFSFELKIFSLFSMVCSRPKHSFMVCWILNRFSRCAPDKITLSLCGTD